jgi:hypothetical protein
MHDQGDDRGDQGKVNQAPRDVECKPYMRTVPWVPEALREVRQHIPQLLAEQARIRKVEWFPS